MYKVIRAFKDLEDNNKLYNVGDIFPTAGKSKERVAYLKSSTNKLGEPVIKYVKSKEEKPL
jgi:hypothetical protein